MNQSYQTRLAEILDYLGESYYPMHEYPDQPIYTDRNKEAIAGVQQQITELFLEIIGEDDKIGDPVEDSIIPMQFTEVQCRNTLKNELRKAIEG